jgi:hypothetical protein
MAFTAASQGEAGAVLGRKIGQYTVQNNPKPIAQSAFQ